MEEKKSNGIKVGIVSIFLALLLALAAALMFKGLEAAVDYTPAPPTSSSAADSSASQSGGDADVAAPKFCPHCGDKLTESFQWDQFCPFCGKQVAK